MVPRTLTMITLMLALVFDGIEGAINNQPLPVPVGERTILAEGPYWHDQLQLLFFVDMRPNILNSYDPVTDKHVRVKIKSEDSPVTFMVRVKGTMHWWVLGLKGRLVSVRWDGHSTTPLVPHHYLDVVDPASASRLNDADCDPSYRLWAGSMGGQTGSNPNTFEDGKGALFLVNHNGKIEIKETNLQLSNGLCWNLNADKMYFIDSLQYKVFQYDFDNSKGEISNRHVLFDLKAEGLVDAMNSLPDGMTMDEEGYLWVAVYGTQKVIRIDPSSGKKVFELTIPEALQITSVTFGGKNLDIMFVTTARVDWTDELEKQYPKSGYLFKVTGLGVKGTRSRECAFDDILYKVNNIPPDTSQGSRCSGMIMSIKCLIINLLTKLRRLVTIFIDAGY